MLVSVFYVNSYCFIMDILKCWNEIMHVTNQVRVRCLIKQMVEEKYLISSIKAYASFNRKTGMCLFSIWPNIKPLLWILTFLEFVTFFFLSLYCCFPSLVWCFLHAKGYIQGRLSYLKFQIQITFVLCSFLKFLTFSN